jgi:O-antigen/teichoic acid export membrane protein
MWWKENTVRKNARSEVTHFCVLADQALVSGSNFVLGVVLARSLEVSTLGRYWLLMFILFFIMGLQQAAIGSPLLSIGPLQRRFTRRAYVSIVAVHELLFCGGCAAVMLFVAALGDPLVHLGFPVVIAFVLSSALYQLQDFARRCLFFLGNPMLAFAGDAVSYLGQTLILLRLAQSRRLDLPAVFWVSALTSAFALLIALHTVPLPQLRPAAIRSVWARHWATSRFLLGGSILQWISRNLFSFAAPIWLGASAVGILRASYSVVGATNVWSLGLENSLPTEASTRYLREGDSGLRRYVTRSTAILLGGTGLLAAALSWKAHFILALLYGARFSAYEYVLRSYALLVVLTIAPIPFQAGLRARENTRPTFLAYSAATFLTVVLSPVLPRFFGLRGVLGGMLLVQTLYDAILIGSFLTHNNPDQRGIPLPIRDLVSAS